MLNNTTKTNPEIKLILKFPPKKATEIHNLQNYIQLPPK